jgi:hypothetical protein
MESFEMSINILSVLTQKSAETILAQGGSQSWKLSVDRARSCRYIVLYRHEHHPDVVAGRNPSGSPFLVGIIDSVVPANDGNIGRWLIRFVAYAFCDADHFWQGRNPVAYTSEKEFGQLIDFDRLAFMGMPIVEPQPSRLATQVGLTILQAKKGLSMAFNVPIEAIEITIKG